MVGDLPYSEDATHLTQREPISVPRTYMVFFYYFDFSSFITASVRALTFHFTFIDTHIHISAFLLFIISFVSARCMNNWREGRPIQQLLNPTAVAD